MICYHNIMIRKGERWRCAYCGKMAVMTEIKEGGT